MKTGRIKVFLLQDFITNYRVPLYKRIANLPGVDFSFFYSEPSLQQKSEGFRHVENAEGFRKVKVRHQSLWGNVYQFPFIKHLVSKRPDVVITGRGGTLDTLVFLVVCKAFGIKIFWWAGGVPYVDKKKIDEMMSLGRLARWFGRLNPRLFLFKQADGMIVYSEHAKRYYSNFGFPNSIFVAPNSVDTDTLAAYRKKIEGTPGLVERLRKEYAPNGEKIVLMIGRLNKERKTDLLINTFASIQGYYPPTALIIVGDGYERQPLEEMVAAKGLKNIHFVGAIYDDEILSQYLMASDIYVTPGIASLTIKMAMSFGKPVVTVAYGLEVHTIENGFNGFIVDIDDVAGLAQKILLLLTEEDLRKKIGEAAEATVRDRININTMIQGFETAIRSFS